MSSKSSKSSRAERGTTVRAALVAVLGALALQGCAIVATTDAANADVKKTQDAVAKARTQIEADKHSGPVRRMSGSKIGGDEIALDAEQQLPPIFRQRFTYATQSQPLWAVANEISERTGVPVRVVNVARFNLPDGGAAPRNGANGNTISLDHQGTLGSLLDAVAQKSRSYWRWSDGAVEFFDVETRTFQIYLARGKRNVANAIRLAGSGGSKGGAGVDSGTVAVDSKLEVDMYASLVASIEALIAERGDFGGAASVGGATKAGGAAAGGAPASGGSAGSPTTAGAADGAASGKAVLGKSRVVANPALGLITVTTTPPVMQRVAQYVKAVNERFAQNVRIDVKIYNLTLNRGANAGFSADLVYRKLGSFGLTTSSQGFLQPNSTQPSRAGFAITDPSSRWNGTQLLVEALAEYGDVGFVTSGQVLAVNGQPAPLQVADEITYLASSTTTLTPNVGTTTTQTAESRTIGLTANFLPLVLGDNRILLQYEITYSQLGRLRQIGTATNFIEAPNIPQQSLQQQAYVRDGETLVLFGYESNRSEAGGNTGVSAVSRSASQARQVTIITIQVHGGRNA
ncbi:MAG: hypothetical protein L6Q73_12830 [Aquabacterium sp.]|jgi:hypothetical protein|nr:hypothetical protein [Aquabacterium sp.]